VARAARADSGAPVDWSMQWSPRCTEPHESAVDSWLLPARVTAGGSGPAGQGPEEASAGAAVGSPISTLSATATSATSPSPPRALPEPPGHEPAAARGDAPRSAPPEDESPERDAWTRGRSSEACRPDCGLLAAMRAPNCAVTLPLHSRLLGAALPVLPVSRVLTRRPGALQHDGGNLPAPKSRPACLRPRPAPVRRKHARSAQRVTQQNGVSPLRGSRPRPAGRVPWRIRWDFELVPQRCWSPGPSGALACLRAVQPLLRLSSALRAFFSRPT
jgi:hypothetical protein